MEHDEKHPQPKFGGNWFMGARDMAAWYLISPTEISVNWSGSKQLWTRPIYTDFNGANLVFMRPYFGPPWTNSCQIWCVRVFHLVLLKYSHENAEMQKRKFDDVTLQYSILSVYTSFFYENTWDCNIVTISEKIIVAVNCTTYISSQ